MKLNYKRLGEYIREVNVQNRDLTIKQLIGLSIQKEFIPSIANTIGTDMSTYRIIKRRQFAYCPVTSRNGEKITIALFDKYDEAILSQAYTVFEITDTNEILPEYLMMWFCRPEFDRYSRYKSHGSVRELFDWGEMCEVELPVPTIEKQQEIVAEYKTVTNRIETNNRLIQKLEETAQAIYKQWFVDFEFPNEEGKPYKSNGGEMVESEMGEVPKGWRVGKLSSIATYLNGLAMQNYVSESLEYIPVLKIRELSQGFFDESSDKAKIGIPKEYIIDDGDIIFSWSGTLKVEIWAGGKGGLNQHLFKVTSTISDKWFYYLWTLFHLKEFIRIAEGKATSLGHIKREHLDDAKVLIPNRYQLDVMDKVMNPIISSITRFKVENNSLIKLKNLLLVKMAKKEIIKN